MVPGENPPPDYQQVLINVFSHAGEGGKPLMGALTPMTWSKSPKGPISKYRHFGAPSACFCVWLISLGIMLSMFIFEMKSTYELKGTQFSPQQCSRPGNNFSCKGPNVYFRLCHMKSLLCFLCCFFTPFKNVKTTTNCRLDLAHRSIWPPNFFLGGGVGRKGGGERKRVLVLPGWEGGREQSIYNQWTLWRQEVLKNMYRQVFHVYHLNISNLFLVCGKIYIT